jgi:hypothetical protein
MKQRTPNAYRLSKVRSWPLDDYEWKGLCTMKANIYGKTKKTGDFRSKEEEIQAQRESVAESRAKRNASLSEDANTDLKWRRQESWTKHKAVITERRKAKKAAETPEQEAERKVRQREYSRKYRAKQTSEEREATKEKQRTWTRQDRAVEIPAKRRARLDAANIKAKNG